MGYDGKVVIETELDTSGFEDGLKDIEKTDVSNKFNKLKDIVGLIGNRLKGVVANVLGISRAVVGLIAKLGLIGALIGGLVLIGRLIADAFQIATQEDEELKAQIEYIKFALYNIAKIMAQSIGKILKWIIGLVYNILGIVGGLIKLISGKNIFSKSTIKDFSNSLKNANKSSKGLSKNLKEIQKTLAGFDEVNKLGGGGTGVGLLGGALGSEDDISKYIEASDDLATSTEKWSKKIKRWFLGGDTLKEGIQNGIQKIKDAFLPLISWFNEKMIKPIIKQYKSDVEPIVKWTKKNVFEPMWKEIKKNLSPITSWLKANVFEPIKSEFTGVVSHFFGGSKETKETILNDWKETKNGLLKDFAPFVNKIIFYINKMLAPFGIQLDYIQEEANETGDTITNSIGGATKNIQEQINKLTGTRYEIDMTSKGITNIGEEIKKVADNLSTLTKKNWKINASLSLKAATQQVKDVLSKVAGVTLPKLAKGGIVNMPGRGVPVGGAIAGERGQEGVIPLTDAQQMEMIGQAIGRYITINLTNVTKLNARQINKEMRKVSAESDFATNG